MNERNLFLITKSEIAEKELFCVQFERFLPWIIGSKNHRVVPYLSGDQK